MSDDLDKLLESDLLETPGDFARSVMRRLPSLPPPARASRTHKTLSWVALTGASVLAIGQLVGFVLGIWAATTAL